MEGNLLPPSERGALFEENPHCSHSREQVQQADLTDDPTAKGEQNKRENDAFMTVPGSDRELLQIVAHSFTSFPTPFGFSGGKTKHGQNPPLTNNTIF